MRGSKLRFGFAVVLGGLCAWVVYQAGQPAGAQPVLKGKDKKDKDKDLRPPGDEALPFDFPYDRDSRRQLVAAREYLGFAEVPWGTVAPLVQGILDAKSDSFFNIETRVGGEIRFHRISVKTEANRIIATFPEAGLQFYQQVFGPDAARLLDQAIKNNYDLPTLSDLSQRYFHTRAGAEGTILLATIHLERGNYLEAGYAFERLLARPGSDTIWTPRTLYKAALALKRSDDPRHAALFATVWDRLARAINKDGGLTLGRRNLTLQQVEAELTQPLRSIHPQSAVREWAMLGGNVSRNAIADGGPPFLDPVFRRDMFYTGDDSANLWIKEQLNALFDRGQHANKGVPLPGLFPVTAPDMIIYRSYDAVYAVATRDHTYNGELYRAGQVRWYSKVVFGPHQLMSSDTDALADLGVRSQVSGWWATYQRNPTASILYENPLVGSPVHDGENVYFVDDLSILPPPTLANPNFGIPANTQVPLSGDLADGIRAGQLVAVNMQTGAIVWELGRVLSRVAKEIKDVQLPNPLNEEEADKATDAFRLCLDAVFLGPPLPLNGRLYVLIEQGGTMRLLCLDPKSLVKVEGLPSFQVPTLLWSQKLGRPNETLPADSIRRPQGAFLAAGEGILVCPTNSGAVIGVDIMSRSLLWAHAYRKVEVPTRTPGQPFGGRPTQVRSLPDGRWRAAAPLVSGGRVILTAYDSNKLECLDLRTGKLLWEMPRDANDLYVGGVANDKVIVVSRNQVRAYHLAKLDPKADANAAPTPLLAWKGSENIPTPTGHGAMSKGVYFVPVRKSTAGQDTAPAAEIWAFNTETGVVSSKTVARRSQNNDQTAALAKFGLGNLVFQDGMVFTQSAWEVAGYPQLELKMAEMNRRLKMNPKDPRGLTDRGMLRLDKGELKAAIADFKDAQQNDPPEDVRRQLREKLYVAYTDLLYTDFPAGEQYLREYEGLCELPLTGALPADKVRLEEETRRRKRTHLYLLARGREGQGRLGEAFDKYLELARFEEGKSLIEIPDEPNVRMRPDVWARGRIEAMIRKAANPEARKDLEARVNREWDEVKSGNDLNRLRDFVSVFGQFFPAGVQAEFKLANDLLQTNNDADSREAQTHLAQLRATATDPAIRARATDLLARLMIKNGLMEDAVALFLQLGKDYADVPVRDGKTGTQLLTELLTDKRLLPYLEPSRSPLPARVRAEELRGAGGNPNMGLVEIEPEGDLLPAYRRLRFVLDLNTNTGGAAWTLRAIDKVTGTDRARFPPMSPPQTYNLGTLPFHKFVQASGHLLLVQLGTMVHCLDLAAGKEMWKINLLGEGVVNNPNANPVQPNVNMNADGDVIVKYAEGYYVTLGKAAVLQPGYVALLTRKGLEVVEPMGSSPKRLWTRDGLPERAQVYGDARHVLIVEVDEARKPVSTRLLRALDGMTVEGSVNAGLLMANARSYRIFGSTVLLSEGTGNEPRVVRLYDIATGKDVWRKQYDARAVPIESFSPDWAGAVLSTGVVEILDARTGKPAGTFKLDEKRRAGHLAGATDAQVFTDAERFYVVLNRDPAGPNRRPGINNFNHALRTHKVNGPMYCFDRATGECRWFFEDVFDNQLLLVDQFADLPVVLAAAPMMDKNGVYSYKVVVIEKDRGRLLFNKGVPNNGQVFQAMTIDTRNGTVDIARFDVRIHIRPDHEAKK